MNKSVELSFAQKRLWFLDKLIGPSAVYNIGRLLRVNGALNIEALRSSINEIVRRHEVLRSYFYDHEGEPVQQISNCLTIDLPIINLLHLPEEEREAEAIRLEREEGEQPFDLETGPLIRTTLIQLEENQYLLLLTIHHIVFDGWSSTVFDRELSHFYNAEMSGAKSPLAELSMQYPQFAATQNTQMIAGTLEKEIAYWIDQLSNLPVLNIPTDRPRPSKSSQKGSVQRLRLPLDLSSRLEALRRKKQTTPFIMLLAVFNVLLQRYTDQKEIVVGCPIAGRTGIKTEQMIGFFVNSLTMRTDLSGNPGFSTVLARTSKTVLGAFSNQEAPFERLVEELEPERELGRNPLFQVMFVFQDMPEDELILSGLKVEELSREVTTSVFDLTLSAQIRQGTLDLKINYRTDLFDEVTIQRMLGHYRRLLEGIIGDSDQAISLIPLLTKVEEQCLLVEWNDTEKGYLHNVCVHHLFQAQAGLTPDRIALVCGASHITYAKLEAEANQMANYLIQLGVGPEDLVGTCMSRSTKMVVTLLGIVKAGGAYLPLDPFYPSGRLGVIVQNAKPKVIIGNGEQIHELARTGILTVSLEKDREEIGRASSVPPVCRVVQENLAYVIYTSGSTGLPKGVMIPHRALSNHVCWRREFMKLTEKDRVLQKTSLGFDVSAWEIFGPLSSGALLVLEPLNSSDDTSTLTELIVNEGITMISLVPSQLRNLIEEPRASSCRSLRLVNCGGEVLTPEIVERFFCNLSAQLYNGYGPTESTVGVVYWLCQTENNRLKIPIGKAIANTEIYLLDSHEQLVPIGVPGEIYLGGQSLARGYLNAPALTSERFRANPFEMGCAGKRIYCTGDLGRYLQDSNLEFLGRKDRQVKIRGLRIELGEIEALLQKQKGVQQAVVMVREETPGDQRLVAFVEVEQGFSLIVNELRRSLHNQLPGAMVPGAIVVMDELPLTSNGKLDLAALSILSLYRSSRSRNCRSDISRRSWASRLRVATGLASSRFRPISSPVSSQ